MAESDVGKSETETANVSSSALCVSAFTGVAGAVSVSPECDVSERLCDIILHYSTFHFKQPPNSACTDSNITVNSNSSSIRSNSSNFASDNTTQGDTFCSRLKYLDSTALPNHADFKYLKKLTRELAYRSPGLSRMSEYALSVEGYEHLQPIPTPSSTAAAYSGFSDASSLSSSLLSGSARGGFAAASVPFPPAEPTVGANATVADTVFPSTSRAFGSPAQAPPPTRLAAAAALLVMLSRALAGPPPGVTMCWTPGRPLTFSAVKGGAASKSKSASARFFANVTKSASSSSASAHLSAPALNASASLSLASMTGATPAPSAAVKDEAECVGGDDLTHATALLLKYCAFDALTNTALGLNFPNLLAKALKSTTAGTSSKSRPNSNAKAVIPSSGQQMAVANVYEFNSQSNNAASNVRSKGNSSKNSRSSLKAINSDTAHASANIARFFTTVRRDTQPLTQEAKKTVPMLADAISASDSVAAATGLDDKKAILDFSLTLSQ